MGRHFRGRRGAASRLVDRAIRLARPSARASVECDRDRGPRSGDRAWRFVGAGSASGVRRPADQRRHDHAAVAHHSGGYRPEPRFHSHRHFLSAGEERGPGAGAPVARRRTGEIFVRRVRQRTNNALPKSCRRHMRLAISKNNQQESATPTGQ
jgi:hypothetical protein